MNLTYKILISIYTVLFLTGCVSWKTPAEVSDELPDIFPDYRHVTVPSNIAPLNFMVEDAGRIQAIFAYDGQEIFKVSGKDGIIDIPFKKWYTLLSQVKGGSVDVHVSIWNNDYPDGIAYEPFKINIAADDIDPWIAYRLIEPGYVGWRQLGIYQRELSSFEECEIVTNRESNTTCVNCHNFPSYSSESMMFHARGANGGTILYKDGKLSKIDFKSIGPKKNTTYPAWHPAGRYIAFSSNTTHQVFFGEGSQPIEVFDTASDIVIYDTQSGNVLTDPRFVTEDVLESFPAWSPDGKFLYFVSAVVKARPIKVEDLHYNLLRVSFDQESGMLGSRVDTLYNVDMSGGSTSYPRISADGRYMLYTWSQYGTFPIWHNEADLKMFDLTTNENVDVSEWNDPDNADSYHSWSSNGKWVMFGSRRLDGRYTRLYIAYLNEDGQPCRPFLLPQKDPRSNMWRLKSYNVPEFIDGKVELPKGAADLFYVDDKAE